MEPVCATLWVVLIVSEVPALTVVLGGAVIIAGIAFYSRVAAEENNEE